MRRLQVVIMTALLCIFFCSACQDTSGDNVTALVLHPKEKELTLGMPYRAATHLSVEIRPADVAVELVWSSSNEKVAVVDAFGFVTALTPGTARITVKDVISGKKSTCTLKIRTMPQELNIRAYHAELREGQKLNLSPKLSPAPYIPKGYRIITWSSSNVDVALVDARGRVTAVGIGNADITALTVNGLTATCHVTVTE